MKSIANAAPGTAGFDAASALVAASVALLAAIRWVSAALACLAAPATSKFENKGG